MTMTQTNSDCLDQTTRVLLGELNVPKNLLANASGSQWRAGTGNPIVARSPTDGSELGTFAASTPADVELAAQAAAEAFQSWRTVPAPRRGELVRQIGERLRASKSQLARLVTNESGKIYQEALGEVQEMIDICDFAVGLSRQLYGLSIVSERPMHRMTEQYHPLGPIGVISAFNFPVAVWSWNAMVALVCGDPIVWKPSEKTPLCGMACHSIATAVANKFADAPANLFQLVQGRVDIGQAIASSRHLALVSATGSVAMGRSVGVTVAGRFGRPLLELGGNNAAIITPTADLDLALRGIVFSAFGTCGQRCTSLRRLIVHDSIANSLVNRIQAASARLPIGDPLLPETLIGPLIDEAAYEGMQATLQEARVSGAKITGGERVTSGVPTGGFYVRPAVVEIDASAPVVQRETFAPILYCLRYKSLDEAIALQNGVPQGLSSSIFTSDFREAELFCSPSGSDCGIANVNIGTSGAEIGGAFGGEKETGGGREAGSDSWKIYMRRVTNTINYSRELPLAQGIKFDI